MSRFDPQRPPEAPTAAPTLEDPKPLPADPEAHHVPSAGSGAVVVDFNRASRRAMLNAAVWSIADQEREDPDVDRLLTLVARMGEVVDAYRFGHADIDDELLKVAACALAQIEAHGRDAAA